MEIVLPEKIVCSVSVNGVGVKNILIRAEFDVSYKNPYSVVIGPTNKEGNAQITSQQIFEEANKQMNIAIMDYKPIKEFFTGVVTVNIMDKEELEKAINAYELFKGACSYKSNYKDNLNQALETLGTIEKDELKLNASIEPSNIKLKIR